MATYLGDHGEIRPCTERTGHVDGLERPVDGRGGDGGLAASVALRGSDHVLGARDLLASRRPTVDCRLTTDDWSAPKARDEARD